MELTEEMLEKMKKQAWQEGYDAALAKVKMSIKMNEMGMAHCEIVKRTDLPPVIIHAICGEEH